MMSCQVTPERETMAFFEHVENRSIWCFVSEVIWSDFKFDIDVDTIRTSICDLLALLRSRLIVFLTSMVAQVTPSICDAGVL